MLTQNEELWEMSLSPAVEELLRSTKDPLADRSVVGAAARKQAGRTPESLQNESSKLDATRVVNYRVPHNAVAQVYDYKRKRARFVFGPDLVMLDADEEFTILSLSGGKPKRPNLIRSLCLLLGPDFCSDSLVVETADHARLPIQLSYNWQHEAERLEQEAKGRVERQKIEDEASAEEARRSLLELQVQLATLESTGQARAEAQIKAEATRIANEA
nr:major vault protein [Hymenolepis microstoma]